MTAQTPGPLVEQAARAYVDFRPLNIPRAVNVAAARMFVDKSDRIAFRARVSELYAERKRTHCEHHGDMDLCDYVQERAAR